ncbi:Ig-like domain-containing protein [Microbacterium sp. JZ31]|uniref:Ig-like domain-containing protein n=1 Tax=Microbacterium sp. JZ31 TaxID=1906274 RepID=UPI0019320AB0|nr:Ig-like domain-containing protein [Microbacterium sp. JZ31]
MLVATRTELLSLPLDGSEPTATEAGGFTGKPTAPVWLNGCAYGAWMESGRFMRDCIGEGSDLDMPIDKYRADGELRFRVNRDVVMLNNVFSGAAWLASDQLQKVDNWNDLTPPKSEDGVENPDPTTVQVPDPSPPDRGPDNTKPEAANDRFGVRAGGSTILPVLTGYEGDPEGGGTQGADSDPDGDVLVVSLTDDVPRNVTVVPVNNGNALQITVPEDVTTVEPFTYQVDDGRGGVDEAQVTIDVRPEDENTGPQQLRKIAVPVETGNAVTYNVLPDWIDPDGDNIFLQSVTAAEGDEVEFTADGRITYRAISGTQGIVEVNITVSDGHTSVTGVFPLDIRPASSQPPIATPDHLVVRAGQQGTATPLANDLSASKEPLELTQVSEVEGATIVADFTDDSFTFKSNTAGTYYVDYLVATSGTSPVNGLVRVDVLEPVEKAEPPVAVRDVALLPAGGDALVNVLANDSDPAGGVLVVQSVSVEPDSGIAVSVLGHETLRVADTGMTGREPAQATVRYTISNGAETAEGEVVVLAMPKQAKVRPPIANDDTAKVRVGDVVTIPVLENDNHPNGEEFHVASELGEQPAAGEAFVSQDTIRYRAGDEPGAVQFTYRAVDANGQHNSALVKVQILALDEENNNAPRPKDIEARTLEDTLSTIEVPLDGIDPDGDSVDLIGVTGAGAKKGTVNLNESGQFEYTAHDDVSGVDTFTYRVRDALGAEAEATIRVGIAPQTTDNQAPFAVRDTLAMRPDRVVAAPVTDNDNDPDGDRFSLVPGEDGLILGEDPQIEAEAAADLVRVTSPDQELETSLQYTIEDERGARARGVLSIVVDEDVPLQAPIARDDRIRIQDVDIDTGMAEINLLANDEDPDGVVEELTVEVDEEQGVTVDEDGLARVEIGEERRLVGYRITDADDNTARAFLRVPGEQDLRPYLISTTPERVKSGETIELPLAEYVTAPSGKDIRITTAENVSAAHSNGQNLVVDAQTLTYTSADRFAGNDAITFEVTDGSGPDDPNGRVSTLSIPILVTPPDNLPPEMSGASVSVGAGDSEPGTVDLAGLATDIDDDPVSFQVQEAPAGISAEIDGTTLQVRADADQKGTVVNIVVLADDGQANPTSPEPVTANIEVTVTASTRELPVATDDTVSEWNQGETLSHDVLSNDINPFAGEAPLEVIGATLETGAAGDAEVSFDAGHVIVTPAADFHGRLVVRYEVQDMTGDPERTAEGRLNLTVQGVPDAPGKPTVSDVQSRQVTLSWQSPPDNGAAITEYRVQATKGGDYSTVCPETTCTLQGLTNNVTYGFTVTAVNRVGEGDPSPVSQDARPDVRPETPVAPQLPEFRDSGLLVTWKAPRTEGSPITKYELEITPTPPNGVNVREVPAGNTQLWWDGLVNGTAYTVRVRAHNSAPDPSEWSGQSATNIPAKPPEAPGAPTATRQSAIGPEPGGIQVTWPGVEGPANGGDAVDAYRVQAYQGDAPYGDPQTTSGTSAVFSLPASRSDYTFRVTARNKAGWGAQSAPSAGLRQFTSPTAPGTPTVTEGDRQIQASWSPATAQGADEVRYQYNVNGSGWQEAGTATSATIGGLTNGKEYRVAVRAYAVANGTNSEPGPSSAQSQGAVPYGPPHAPIVRAERVNGGTQIQCSWNANGSSNGRPIGAVQARFNDGGWEDVNSTGSRICAEGYSARGKVEVQVTSAGKTSSAQAAERTVDPPPPSANVRNSGVSAAGQPNCRTGNCYFLQLNYANFPGGDYHVSCHDEDSAPGGFAGRTYRLRTEGSERLGCYYGFAGHQVRLHISGPGVDMWTDWWTWQQ